MKVNNLEVANLSRLNRINKNTRIRKEKTQWILVFFCLKKSCIIKEDALK